jgi:hypothetical protein
MRPGTVPRQEAAGINPGSPLIQMSVVSAKTNAGDLIRFDPIP